MEGYYDGSQADNWFHAWPWRWPRDWRAARSQLQSTLAHIGSRAESSYSTQTRPIAHSMSRLAADKIASCVLTKVSC